MHKLPHSLMFHVKQFEFRNGRVERLSRQFKITHDIDLSRFMNEKDDDDSSPTSLRYSLMGAIVHALDKQESGDDNDGHYITYLALG